MADIDSLIYESSATIETPSKPFTDVDWTFVTNGENGSYQQNQVTFDGGALGTSDRFCDWRQAYITLPVILALSDSGTTMNVDAPFAVGMKNFYVNLIHSASLQIGDKQIHQHTPYSNFMWTFKALSEWSADDVQKWGATLGFAKDNALSYRYSAYGTATTDGDGISNCRDFGVSATALNAALPAETSNQGLLQRQRVFCKDFETAASAFTTFQTKTQAGAVGTDYYTNLAGTAANKSKTWFLLAKVRLRDIFPAIAEMPLVKGLSPSITLNLNQGSATITRNLSTPNTFSTSATAISISGGTFPAMLCSSATSNGSSAFSNLAAGTLTLGVFVGKVTNTAMDQYNVQHPTTTNCRLYAPMEKLHPSIAPAYTSLGIKRKVRYTDLLQYRISSVSAGSTVNQLICSGVVNLKRLVIMPFYASSNTNAYNQFLSPFDTAPATRVPFAAISQVNVQISGTNVWNQNSVFSYENFAHEMASTTGLNGGYTPGLTSGLISELDWQALYYTVVCNIRAPPGEEGVPKSVSVQFNNAAAVTTDYFVFLEVEKELSIDIITGQVS